MTTVLQKTVKAVIRADEDGGYVAECLELPVVTQGETLDELVRNLDEAVALALEGEDPAIYGLAPDVTVVATLELTPARA
ncbi:MAG: type II toxin-antitoxin system HicB family antitoxin [Chloroflexota bacterium]